MIFATQKFSCNIKQF